MACTCRRDIVWVVALAASLGPLRESRTWAAPPPTSLRSAADDAVLPAEAGETAVHDAQASAATGSRAAAPPLGADFSGMADDNTTTPPGVSGAVGPDNVVEFLNSGRTIYDKSGTVTSPTISLQMFWSALGTAAGDPAEAVRAPRVLWDHYANRWLVSALGVGSNQWILVGVSQTGDPAGAYTLYAIKANVSTNGFNHNPAPPAGPHRVDFDIMGLDPNNVIITVNMWNNTVTASVHTDVYIINKASLIAGAGGQTLVYNTDFKLVHSPCPTFGAKLNFAPCVTFGQTAQTAVNYVIDNNWYDETDLSIRYFRVAVITGTGAGATYDCMGDANFVTTSGCYNFEIAGASQPDGCATIHPGDVRISSPGIVRNGKIWFAHTAGAPTSPCLDPAGELPATKAEIYWVEQDPANIVSPGLPDQFGVISDPVLAYYYPSIAVSQDDCVMIGFSGSGPDAGQYAAAYYTARQASDAANTMQPVNILKAGEDSYLKVVGGQNRWGDYSTTCVDPSDDSTLWTLQEYARPEEGGSCPTNNTGRWGTWWGSMACTAPCDCLGDVNSDELLNGNDVRAFLDCVFTGTTPDGNCGCADMDQSEAVDSDDVLDLVAALLDEICGL